MNQYVLSVAAIGAYPEISISEDRYLQLETARSALRAAFVIEEKYEILIQNYIDFEKCILSEACEHMLSVRLDYEDFFSTRLKLNTCILNLLTTTKLYIDSISSEVYRCLTKKLKNEVKSDVKALFHRAYDSSMDYRFIELLRNHIQHSSIPIEGLTLSSSKTSSDIEPLIERVLEFYTYKSSLLENKRNSKTKLEELPDILDLKQSIRSYVELLSGVHANIRKLISTETSNHRAIISDAINEYKAIYPELTVGLHAINYNNRVVEAKVPILLHWDDIRLKLIKKNIELVNLKSRYVSGIATAKWHTKTN